MWDKSDKQYYLIKSVTFILIPKEYSVSYIAIYRQCFKTKHFFNQIHELSVYKSTLVLHETAADFVEFAFLLRNFVSIVVGFIQVGCLWAGQGIASHSLARLIKQIRDKR